MTRRTEPGYAFGMRPFHIIVGVLSLLVLGPPIACCSWFAVGIWLDSVFSVEGE